MTTTRLNVLGNPVLLDGDNERPVQTNPDGSTFFIGEANPNKSCGSCTMCCKLMGIPELKKPGYKWCPHVSKDKCGCDIYSDRPGSCRDFNCLWIQATDDSDLGRDELRPDRCKVVVSATNTDAQGMSSSFLLFCDSGMPTAWRDNKYVRALIKSIQMGGFSQAVNSGPSRPTIMIRPVERQHTKINISVTDHEENDALCGEWVELLADGTYRKLDVI